MFCYILSCSSIKFFERPPLEIMTYIGPFSIFPFFLLLLLLFYPQIRVGQALYKTGSLFNHSCKPNIHLYFLSRGLVMRTTEFVPMGCPLELSYGPEVFLGSSSLFVTSVLYDVSSECFEVHTF